MKTYVQRFFFNINVHSSFFIIAKNWKPPKCPSTGKIDIRILVCLFNGMLLSIKKEYNTYICNINEFQNIMLGKRSQRRKGTVGVYWCETVDTAELMYRVRKRISGCLGGDCQVWAGDITAQAQGNILAFMAFSLYLVLRRSRKSRG